MITNEEYEGQNITYASVQAIIISRNWLKKDYRTLQENLLLIFNIHLSDISYNVVVIWAGNCEYLSWQ